jgi:uncharacterized protein YcbX
MPDLAHIAIYPIKSLDGVVVSQATLLPSGALKGDREFALMDKQGKFINGKRTAAIHRIRSQFDLAARRIKIRLQAEDQAEEFHLDRDRPALESWLSQYFGFPVHLAQDTETGFPDDTQSPGPTVISTATLKTITTWFPGLTLEEVRQRFRTNLELAGCEPFWEERLYGDADSTVPFQIGAVQFAGVNPCQRCPVPTRNPLTGEGYPNFQKQFVRQRQQTLPDWAERSRFNHFYRLAINTRVPATEAGKVLQLGDAIVLRSPTSEPNALLSIQPD